MGEKRRLPVLQPRDDDSEETRPAWQWSAIGGGAMLVAFFPLSMLAAPIARQCWRVAVCAGSVGRARQTQANTAAAAAAAAVAARLAPCATTPRRDPSQSL